MTNLGEEVNGHILSKLLQISEVQATAQPNLPTLEKIQSLVTSEAGASTYNERPASFGPLGKEITTSVVTLSRYKQDQIQKLSSMEQNVAENSGFCSLKDVRCYSLHTECKLN